MLVCNIAYNTITKNPLGTWHPYDKDDNKINSRNNDNDLQFQFHLLSIETSNM